jgi:hypothetical protein
MGGCVKSIFFAGYPQGGFFGIHVVLSSSCGAIKTYKY